MFPIKHKPKYGYKTILAHKPRRPNESWSEMNEQHPFEIHQDTFQWNLGGQGFEKKRRVIWARSGKDKKQSGTIAFSRHSNNRQKETTEQGFQREDQFSTRGTKTKGQN